MKQTLMHRKGFTLIELLVVIAIIAILAVILFPVFAQAREKARQAADASNLNQIGLAFLQYQQDYDEYFPQSVTERYAPASWYTNGSNSSGTSPSFVDSSAEASQFSIRGILSPYVKSNGVWHDPSQIATWAWDGPAFGSSVTASSGTHTDTANAATAWYLTDYGFNFDEGIWTAAENGTPAAYGGIVPNPLAVPHSADFLPGGQFVGNGFNGTTNLSKISSPATFILGADSVRQGLTVGKPTVSRGSLTAQPALANDGFSTINWEPQAVGFDKTQAAIHLRHSGGANFLFDDGHVKWLTPEKTWTATTNFWARTQ